MSTARDYIQPAFALSNESEADLAVPERLRRAAARLFASNGFDATTVQQVVEAAGLTKGAFYYYYDSKDQLLYEMHRRVIAHQLNRAGQILAEEEDDLAEALRRLIVELVESIALYRDEMTIVLREQHRFPPDALPRVQVDRRRLQGLYEGAVRAGQQSGLFRRDVSAEVLTFGLLGMCSSTYEWHPRDGSGDAGEIGTGLAAACLGGMLAPPQGPERMDGKRAP
jgi:TetR/AcrR family transcriptional regulator, cholesterol catabolism regulator